VAHYQPAADILIHGSVDAPLGMKSAGPPSLSGDAGTNPNDPVTSERTDRSRPYFGADRSLHLPVYQPLVVYFQDSPSKASHWCYTACSGIGIERSGKAACGDDHSFVA